MINSMFQLSFAKEMGNAEFEIAVEKEFMKFFVGKTFWIWKFLIKF